MITEITTDVALDIATGRSRRETYWKNKTMLWSDLVKRLSVTHRTAETLAEYMAVPKARQDEIKDIGGFVGGLLSGGKRNGTSVIHRGFLTLDMDTAPVDTWATFQMLYDCAACIYSTHKHSPEHPRYRLIIPLNRTVDVTQYEAIGRRVAGDLGIEGFDHTGFQPYRLMYWPSTSSDGVFEFQMQDGPLLDADKVLGTYQDYTDSSQWPVSEKVSGRILRDITKQGDPLTKRGYIGAFCRLYSIAEVIDKFLFDIYEPATTEGENRYTYKNGSTAGGLVVYEDKYAYSHHGTDPISGKLCNAFDLVRLHLFGLRDEDTTERTPITKKPSFKAMTDFVRELPEIRVAMITEKLEAAQVDFADLPELSEKEIVIDTVNRAALGLPVIPAADPGDTDWMKEIEPDQKGDGAKCTFNNIVLILRHDHNLRGKFAFNELKGMPVVLGAVPWQAVTDRHPLGRGYTDRDNSDLRGYIETVYGITGPFKLKDALVSVSHENAFHPICNYLDGLEWDGEERLDRILVDYFGAEDTEYTQAVGRKWMTAAVARVFNPGVKFDYCMTLVGEEGIFKSTFLRTLFDPWFTDNFSFHMIGSTRAAEQIRGYWGIEIGELVGLKRAELEGIKAFLSRQIDGQRGAYREYLEEVFRQCVFAGSTNEGEFLRGANGNRRFWVVQTRVGAPLKVISQLSGERNQLWAEAVALYQCGEKLYLNSDLEKQAKLIQDLHTETDDRAEVIERYLEVKLPPGWEDMILYQRRAFLGGDETLPKGTETRKRVSVAEIWTEALGCQIKDMNTVNTKFIHEIMKKLPGWEKYKSRTMFKYFGNQRGWKKIGSTTSDLN